MPLMLVVVRAIRIIASTRQIFEPMLCPHRRWQAPRPGSAFSWLGVRKSFIGYEHSAAPLSFFIHGPTAFWALSAVGFIPVPERGILAADEPRARAVFFDNGLDRFSVNDCAI